MSGVSNDTVAIISGSQSDRGLTISTYASDGRTDGSVDHNNACLGRVLNLQPMELKELE